MSTITMVKSLKEVVAFLSVKYGFNANEALSCLKIEEAPPTKPRVKRCCKKKHTAKLAAKADSGKCPISGKAANPATQVVHTKRETKYFCCNNCKGKYAKANFK